MLLKHASDHKYINIYLYLKIHDVSGQTILISCYYQQHIGLIYHKYIDSLYNLEYHQCFHACWQINPSKEKFHNCFTGLEMAMI